MNGQRTLTLCDRMMSRVEKHERQVWEALVSKQAITRVVVLKIE